MQTTEDARKLAGLAVGTWWKSEFHDSPAIIIDSVTQEEEHGVEYIKLNFRYGGSQSAEDFMTYVRSDDYKPHGPRADEAYMFVMGRDDD
jgi:hypothetical protein